MCPLKAGASTRTRTSFRSTPRMFSSFAEARSGRSTQSSTGASAAEALRHKTGARGLRTVLEECLLDVMYEIPSRGDVKKCVVDGDAIRGLRRPLMLTRSGQALNLWGEDKGETA